MKIKTLYPIELPGGEVIPKDTEIEVRYITSKGGFFISYEDSRTVIDYRCREFLEVMNEG